MKNRTGTKKPYLTGIVEQGICSICDSVGDGISIQDTDFMVVYQNRVHKSIIGDHVGEYCYRAYEGKESVCDGCPVTMAFRDGQVHRTERGVLIDKGVIYLEVTASPLKDVNGEIVAGVEVVRDITERKYLEALSHQRKQDWASIFDTITDLITIHDNEFNIIFANTSASSVLQLPSLDGSKVKCFTYYHGKECPPKGCPSCECLKTGVPATFELYEPHLNMQIEIRALPRLNIKNEIIGIIHIVRDITSRKKFEEQLRNLAAHLLSVREEERKYIAREIHDELAQSLTALNMDVHWLKKQLKNAGKDLQDKTAAMLKIINMTMHNVQRISSELRPTLLDDLGLQAAMDWQLKEFQNRTGIKCELSFDTLASDVDQERAITVFRIFQETLTNVSRHAKATKIRITIKEKKGHLVMEVKDNGKGITQEQVSSSKSFGLIGIRERINLWNGDVSMKGVQGKGSTIKVKLPLEKGQKKDVS